VDPVLEHRYALHAQAESPAGVPVGIDVDASQDVGVDHTAAEDLQPAAVAAHPAAGALAHAAVDRHLRARLHEGEALVAAEARLAFLPEHAPRHVAEHAHHVAHGGAIVHHQALHLEEHRFMAGVGGLIAIHPPRHEDPDWRLAHVQ